MKVLLGTAAYNKHIQNIALALHEMNALGAFHTGLVDNYKNPWIKKIRHFVKRKMHPLDVLIRRRFIADLPDELIYKNWTWELLRVGLTKIGMNAVILDWIWERTEHNLDRRCARLIKKPQFDMFFGLEHGCLSTLRSAKKAGKKTAIFFVSPHHSFCRRRLDSEYEAFPEFCNFSNRRLSQLAKVRDERRDEEASLADFIFTNSNLTTQSLVGAGFPREKITTVPLGCPRPISENMLPRAQRKPMRFIYAGPLSVRKGAHYLIQAWKLLGQTSTAELHLYGIPLLPKEYFLGCGKNVIFHGSVSQEELFKAYQKGSVLVFPTLYDGFGMVITEAMAHGLPVITTRNAGASDFIEDGKNGFLVPARDVKALADRIQWCLSYPGKLQKMRFFTLASARRFGWSDCRALLRKKLKERELI